MGEMVIPVSLGVVSEPPTLILLYEDGKNPKRRRRRMPVRHFNDRSDVGRAAFAIRQRHEKWMKDVSLTTVERMLRIVQEMIKGLSKEEAVDLVDSEFKVGAEEDLNVVGEDVLRRKKAGMEDEWRRVAVLPGHPEYVWDKQEEFGEAKDPSGWDDDEEDEDDEGSVSVENKSSPEKVKVDGADSSPANKIITKEIKEFELPQEEEINSMSPSRNPLGLESSKDFDIEDDDFWT